MALPSPQRISFVIRFELFRFPFNKSFYGPSIAITCVLKGQGMNWETVLVNCNGEIKTLILDFVCHSLL